MSVSTIGIVVLDAILDHSFALIDRIAGIVAYKKFPVKHKRSFRVMDTDNGAAAIRLSTVSTQNRPGGL